MNTHTEELTRNFKTIEWVDTVGMENYSPPGLNCKTIESVGMEIYSPPGLKSLWLSYYTR